MHTFGGKGRFRTPESPVALEYRVSSIVISEARGVRQLHFGSPWVQGAMRIARPWSLEIEYTRQMMAALVLRPGAGWPARVLQIGLGAASVTRFLHRHRPCARIDVVEILPEVVAAARQYFRLPDDPARLRITIGDGHDHLAGTRARYDFIVVDGFDGEGRAGMLDTPAFYLNCRARLARSGLAAFNLLNRGRGAMAAVGRIDKAFDGHALVLPECAAGNTVVIAGADSPVRGAVEALRDPARELRKQTGLDLLPVVEALIQAR
ncbi:MAG: fused MFS/spermidine synthase [Betaproteobacteria bacterium]|nr:fused MFS/spermidine synthase [Betaproteobacteria bacterium]